MIITVNHNQKGGETMENQSNNTEYVWCYVCNDWHPVTCWQDVFGYENMGCSLDLAGEHPTKKKEVMVKD